MQLNNNGFVIGIKCDLCGDELINDFLYYSLDIKEIQVNNNRYILNDGLPAIFSLDICSKCVATISEEVRTHYSPTSVGINCDLCGSKMRGSFVFYYMNISSVSVSMSNGQVRCGACDLLLTNTLKPCKCGKTRPTKFAAVNVNDKYLQVVMCQRNYDSLVGLATAIRQQVSSKQ